MCVKLPFRDLNSRSYPLHPISTYTYKMTITPRVCGGNNLILKRLKNNLNFIVGLILVSLYLNS